MDKHPTAGNGERASLVFNIKRCSFEDGPGIRTTIFLKGCPLRCKWCCNPEGQELQPELSDSSGNNEFFERYMTVSEIMDIIFADRAFYDTSGGGVTIAGGEPTMHYEFVHDILQQCKKESIHTALDTCGWVEGKNAGLLMEADLLLYDIKILCDEDHISHTGLTNQPILENLKNVAAAGKPVIIRIPIIPGFTDSEYNISGIGALLSNYKNIERIELIPFHRYGSSKYQALHRQHLLNEIPLTTREQIENIVSVLKNFGLDVWVL